MDDRNRTDGPQPPDPSEGVRIIGEDEAAEALRSGSVASRRPEGEPRYGDRPAAPEGPRPSLRFPMAAGDPSEVAAPKVVPPDPTTQLPHWSEPPTGQVPKILASDEDEGEEEAAGDDLSAWSSFATGAPRWRDQPQDWEEADFDDASMLADESTRVGALDPRRQALDDLFNFDEPDDTSDVEAEPEPIFTPPRPSPIPEAPDRPEGGAAPSGAGTAGGRNVPVAIATALAFAAVALLLLKMGPGPAMVLVAAVVTLAAAELYASLQQAGFHPATLLGLVTTASLIGAAYWRGEDAYPLVLGLGVIFTLLIYLAGAARHRITANVGATVLGFGYVGLLGSFAALMLKWPHDDGIGLVLGAVIATVGYDVGGFFIGSRIGTSRIAPEISPNKTFEGLVGGMGSAVILSAIVVGQIHPWSFGSALALGVVAAIVAPLGDLCESMIKRDLGIKDTGSILPGHGGLLDRFDALLFVLPATYYVARVLNLG